MTQRLRHRLLLGLLLVLLLAGLYLLLERQGLLARLFDGPALRAWIEGLGLWGPFAVIGLMAFAILVSPLPSAPIALAAGAAYGHSWGTLYVLLGSEAGALAAFGLARLLGRDLLERWLGARLTVGLLGSQGALMAVVFLSRLLPFVSFDLISYAAGLTVLRFWRFALATLAGIAPASFLLAHFGGEMASGEAERALFAVLLLGGVTLLPILAKLLRDRWRAKPDRAAGKPPQGPV